MADAAWVALSLIRGVGGRTFSALLETFGTPEAVLAASANGLLGVKGVGSTTTRYIAAIDVPRVAGWLKTWQSAGVRAIGWNEPDYPAILREAKDAPPTLFVKGRWPVMTARSVAIVGTRTPTPAAADLAKQLSFDLAQKGVTVVSGLALGIDAAAHTAAIASPQGVTVAVLGSGILKVYPYQNRELAAAVEQRGALLCEIRPDAPVNAPALVARNRILSGLSQAVVVIQTDADGGALHAARFAAGQDRKVYAIDDPLGNPDAKRGIETLRANGAIMLSPSELGSLANQYGG